MTEKDRQLTLLPFCEGGFISAWIQHVQEANPDVWKASPFMVKALGATILSAAAKIIIPFSRPKPASIFMLTIGRGATGKSSLISKVHDLQIPIISGTPEYIAKELQEEKWGIIYHDEIHSIFKNVRRRGYMSEWPETVKLFFNSDPVKMGRKTTESTVLRKNSYYVCLVGATTNEDINAIADNLTEALMRRLLITETRPLPYTLPPDITEVDLKNLGTLTAWCKTLKSFASVTPFTLEAREEYNRLVAKLCTFKEDWVNRSLKEYFERLAAIRAVDRVLFNTFKARPSTIHQQISTIQQLSSTTSSTDMMEGYDLERVRVYAPSTTSTYINIHQQSSTGGGEPSTETAPARERLALDPREYVARVVVAWLPFLSGKGIYDFLFAPVTAEDVRAVFLFLTDLASSYDVVQLHADPDVVEFERRLGQLFESRGFYSLRELGMAVRKKYDVLVKLLETMELMGKVKVVGMRWRGVRGEGTRCWVVDPRARLCVNCRHRGSCWGQDVEVVELLREGCDEFELVEEVG